MDWSNKRILVLDGGSRQCLPVLKGLHDIGCRITTVNESRLDNGYSSRYPDERLLRGKGDPWAYILEQVKTGKYDALIPLSDASTDLVTRHLAELKPHVCIPVPEREVFLDAYNKQHTMEICMDIGVPCPITRRENETVDEAVRKIGFPLIAKPRMACGSVGLKIVRDRGQLDRLLSSGEVPLDDYVLQEFIPQTGRQYNIHLFMDDERNLKSGLVTEKTRWFPVDGGASCLCRTIEDAKVLADCEKLIHTIGWRGYCEIEMIEDPRDGLFKVMEINGRASASIKIMQLAGMNVGQQMAELAFGEEVTAFTCQRQDVRMRRIATDLLWLIKAPDRFTRKPSWFSPVRTHEVVFSLADPKPFFASALSLVTHAMRYRQEMEARSRN